MTREDKARDSGGDEASAGVADALCSWDESLRAEPWESIPQDVWLRTLAQAEYEGRAARGKTIRSLPRARWLTPLVAASAVGLAFAAFGSDFRFMRAGNPEQVSTAQSANRVSAANDPVATADDGEVEPSNSGDFNLALSAEPELLTAGVFPPTKAVIDVKGDIASEDVPETVEEVLGNLGVSDPQEFLSMNARPWVPKTSGFTTSEDVLRTCVTRVTKLETSQALIVLRGTIDGSEAGVIVVPHLMREMKPGGQEAKTVDVASPALVTIYVVEPLCGTGNTQVDSMRMEMEYVLWEP